LFYLEFIVVVVISKYQFLNTFILKFYGNL
jgi:hypothetical protein